MSTIEDDDDRLAELLAKPSLTIAERIERWRLEPGGEETEYPTELLCAAEDALKAQAATLKRVHDWLSSFSMPPTSTIAEKQEYLAILEAAIAKAEGRTP